MAKTITRTRILQALTERTSVPKKDIVSVLDALAELAVETMKSGERFLVPGIARVELKDKAATPEREGINPHTKEKITIAAKPASKRVRVSPLKALKDQF